MSVMSLSARTALAVAILAVLGTVAAPADAQTRRPGDRDERSAPKKSEKAPPMFPDAKRKEPETKASAKLVKKLQKLGDLYDKDDNAAILTLAEEIIADPKANAYDRSFAAQIAAQAAYALDKLPEAERYSAQVIEFNGLDNTGHYQSLYMQAQLQLQQDQYAKGLATMDRFLAESGSQKPEHLAMKANALYQLERFPEAVAILKQVIAASPTPKSEWNQMLLGAYSEMGQPQEAAKIAEQIAAKSPNDKRAQLNLAATYLQSDMLDKAAVVLEKIRASGQMTEDKDYRQLYATYLNLDGKEKEAIAVINEGLQKGVLKPDHQTYLALAQAYYFSDQPGPAIDAYKKAAPLDDDGDTYLNLARVLWQEDRLGEAKQAAQQALNKGIKKPEDAKKILAQPGK